MNQICVRFLIDHLGTSDPRKGAYLEQDLARMDDDSDDGELKKPSSHSAKADTTMYVGSRWCLVRISSSTYFS